MAYHGFVSGVHMNGMNGKNVLIDALKACGAVKFGNFKLASGEKSNYYIDIKKASTNPSTLRIIAKEAGRLIEDMDVDAIGGVVLGGVPLATAVSLEADLPLVLIRKSEKGYGTGGRFVGEYPKGAKILLLEDVTTSGGSVKDAIKAINESGGIVDHVVTVVDRDSGAEKNLADMGVQLIPLVRASDLI